MDNPALDDRSISLGDAENWLALGAGAVLLLAGASRRSAIGACLAVSSAPLLYRGITGRWPDVLNGSSPTVRRPLSAVSAECAVCWEGKEKIRVETVPDPVILNPRDAIIKVTTTAICGSDLHIYDGYIPTMQKGDVLGHEFMGEVVEVGKDNHRLKVGDRVVVPFTIACGHCYFCKEQLWSLCDNSNPNAWMAEKLYGYSASGLFGYSHMYGGYPGGQAEYARVFFADIGPLKVPDNLLAEQHRKMAEPGSGQHAND